MSRRKNFYLNCVGNVDGRDEIHIYDTSYSNHEAYDDTHSSDFWTEVNFLLCREYDISKSEFDHFEYFGRYLYVHVPKGTCVKNMTEFLENQSILHGWHNSVKTLQSLVRDSLGVKEFLVSAIFSHLHEKNDLIRTRVLVNLIKKKELI